MPIGVNPGLSGAAALPMTLTGETTDASAESLRTAAVVSLSCDGDITGNEEASGASSPDAAPEAGATQSTQSENADVSAGGADRSEGGLAEPVTELDSLGARKLAMKARSERTVAALVETISSPIAGGEYALLEQAECYSTTVSTDAQSRMDLFEEKPGAVQHGD